MTLQRICHRSPSASSVQNPASCPERAGNVPACHDCKSGSVMLSGCHGKKPAALQLARLPVNQPHNPAVHPTSNSSRSVPYAPATDPPPYGASILNRPVSAFGRQTSGDQDWPLASPFVPGIASSPITSPQANPGAATKCRERKKEGKKTNQSTKIRKKKKRKKQQGDLSRASRITCDLQGSKRRETQSRLLRPVDIAKTLLS
ncbi:hypothetical protein VTH06DRAFT_8609 [Thermothelomyces fergusii]